MECGELLGISEYGKQKLNDCPGYQPSKRMDRGRACVHCGFDFWDHTSPLEKAHG